MNWLTAFGLLSVSLMLAFYALEDRSRWFILGFQGPVSSPLLTDSFKGLGPSVLWKQSGFSWRYDGGRSAARSRGVR